jgi:hypothetical protein
MYIGIRMKPIDGFGNVVGYGTPKYTRVGASADHYGHTGIAISAIMEFDTADAQDLVDRGLFDELILHEMAHALGFGKLTKITVLLCASTSCRGMLLLCTAMYSNQSALYHCNRQYAHI